jgi:hypothetical protein
VFLGCLFGGDTLFELRVSLQLAEQEKEGVSKLVDSSGLMVRYWLWDQEVERSSPVSGTNDSLCMKLTEHYFTKAYMNI